VTRSTQNYSEYFSTRCSYCHKELYPLYHGEGCCNLYICNCEEAKEELKLHPKLDDLEKQINEIKSSFPKVDYDKANKIQLEEEIENLKSMYGNQMTNLSHKKEKTMTREEIVNMKDRDEINTSIAKILYGYSVYEDSYSGDWYYKSLHHDPILVPNYCEDMNTAWGVYMGMMKGYFSGRKRFYDELQFLTKTECGLTAYPDVFTSLRYKMPESICKAALLSKLSK